MSFYGRPPTSSAANRPTSRIGSSWGRSVNATTTQAGPTPALGVGVGVGLRQPPKTGQLGGMMPPPSRMNARPGSSMRVNIGLTSSGDRLGTHQGISGVPKTSYQGSGRTVQDRSYWIGEIKLHLSQVVSEINKIQSDMAALEREQAGTMTIEKRAVTLTNELRDLQGQLGDYNMLFDKLHTDVDLDEVVRTATACANQNDELQKSVDTLFMDRQEKEQKIKQLEEGLKTIKERTTEQISTKLDPVSREKWTVLESENGQLHSELLQTQIKLTQLTAQRSELEKIISQDTIKLKLWTLQDRKLTLQTKLRDMQLQSSHPSSTLDTKEAILDDIKSTNSEIAHMEKKMVETEREHNRLVTEIHSMQSSVAGDKAAKYDELVKKDKEMKSFLDTFPTQNQTVSDQLNDLYINHRNLLGEIQSLTVTPMATPADLARMAGDLAEKDKELTTAESTMAHIAAERERLVADLAQIDSLESKIAIQLSTCVTRMHEMKVDLDKYARVDETKIELTKIRDQLLNELDQIRVRRQWAHISLTANNTKLRVKQSQLSDNETSRTLSQLQSKWRHLESNNFALHSQISDKVANADFHPARDEVLKLTDQCLTQNAKMVNMAM